MRLLTCTLALLLTASPLLAEPETLPGPLQTDESRDLARREPPPDTGLLYHLTWYSADYATTAALAGLAFGLMPMWKPGQALYGPQFDPALPDMAVLNDPANARMLGSPYREDTVPTWWIYAGIGVLGGSAIAYDGLRHLDAHRVHNLTLGLAESMIFTHAATELLKRGVGRLRPDFRDRATRYYCNPDGGARRDLAGLDCSAVDADGVYLDAGDLEYGRKSFVSGHSSSSFALATFLALYAGGELVWGEHASPATVPAGAALMAGLWGVASTVAATRLSDGRHHFDDVAAGAALGATASALFYFLHFDTRGRATYRGLAVAPVALDDGVAVSLAFQL